MPIEYRPAMDGWARWSEGANGAESVVLRVAPGHSSSGARLTRAAGIGGVAAASAALQMPSVLTQPNFKNMRIIRRNLTKIPYVTFFQCPSSVLVRY